MRKEKSGMFKLPKQVRKALAATLSLSMIFGTTVFTSYAEDSKTIYMGDVNQDGQVNLDDVTLALKGALTIVKLTDEQESRADVNYDKNVNLDDVTKILKVALTIDPPFTATPAPTNPVESTDPDPVSPTPPGPTDPVSPTPPGPTDPVSPTPVSPTPPGPTTPPPPPGPTAVTDVPKVTVGAYDFETTTGVVAMNEAANGAVITKTTETSPGSVLLLGKPNAEAEAIVGVQMTNPYAGKTEFSQDIIGAFLKTGIAFNGHTYLHKGDIGDDKSDDYRRVLDASTKTKAISKYNSAVTSFERNLLRDYVSEQALDVKYIAEHPEDTANTTLKQVRDNASKGNLTGAAFGLLDSKVYLKDYTQDDLFNSYATGGYDPSKGELENYTFPYPSWTNGLTVSVWVKIDATLDSSKTGTPIYSFSDGVGALTIRTDGRVQFTEGITTNETKRNSFVFNYDKSVMNNAGQWVYVTTVIRNDGIVVYYNGVKAEGKPESGYQNYKTNQKTFNYGFGYDDGRSVAEMTAGIADEGRYSDLLKNFKPTETDYSDISKYYVDEKQVALVDFVISPYTELYLGGDDGSVIWGLSGYSAANEGMMLDDMSFAGYPMDATEAAVAYENATMHYNADFDAVKSVNFAAADIIPLTQDEIDEGEQTAGNEVEKGVLTMTEDIADATLGIQIVNPFSTMYDQLHEDVYEAMERSGVVLNANLRRFFNTDGNPDDDYYRVSEGGTKVKVWETYQKIAGDAAKNCYGLAYYIGHTEKGQAALTNYMTKYHPDLSGDALEAEKAKLINLFAVGANGPARTNYKVTAEAMGLTQADYLSDEILENAYRYDVPKDMGTSNPTNDALDVYTFPYPTWEKGVTMSFYAKVDGIDITRAAVVLVDNAGNPVKDAEGAYTELTLSGDGIYYDKNKVPATVTASAVVDERVSPVSNMVSRKENATIFTFENSVNPYIDLAALTFKADGTLLFSANNKGVANNPLRNGYSYKFGSGAPADKFDQFVHVTIIIQNDGVRVLYDGVEAKGVATNSNYLNGKNPSQFFNYGLGVATNTTPEERTQIIANANKYNDILKNFGLTKDFSDFSLYNVDETRIPMIDFIADPDTQLYIGGGDAKSAVTLPNNPNAAANYAGYTYTGSISSGSTSATDASTAEANIGMQISNMNFYAQVLPDRILARDYNALVKPQ